MERHIAPGSCDGQLDVAFAETTLTALVENWESSVEELGGADPLPSCARCWWLTARKTECRPAGQGAGRLPVGDPPAVRPNGSGRPGRPRPGAGQPAGGHAARHRVRPPAAAVSSAQVDKIR